MYVSVDDVRAKLTGSQQYPQVPAPPNGVGTAADITDDQITMEIWNAQGQVDAYLAAQYTVPFPGHSVPLLVAEITSDIAAYLSDINYRTGAGLGYENERRAILLRYKRAQTLLEALGSGDMQLPPGPGEEDPPAPPRDSGVYVFNPYAGDLFTACDVWGEPDHGWC